MKRTSMLLALAAVLLVLLAWPAHAGKALLYGSVGANGAWLTGPAAAWPADLEAQGNVWASISPHMDLYANGVYGFTHSYLRGEGGVKVTATDVENRNFNLYLKVGYRGGSIDALQPAEWAYGAGFGWCPLPEQFPRFLIVGDAGQGHTTDRTIAYLGGRYYFPITF